MKQRARCLIAAAAVAAVGAGGDTWGQSTVARWTGPQSGPWHDPTYWSISPGYPNNGIPPGVTYDVDLTPSSPVSVFVENATVIDNLTVGGATVTVRTHGTLQVLETVRILDGGRVRPLRPLTSATITTSGDGRVDAPQSTQIWLQDVLLDGQAFIDISGELIFLGTSRLGPAGVVHLHGEGTEMFIPAGGLRGKGEVVFTGGSGGQSAVRTGVDTEQLDIGSGVTVRIGDGFGTVTGRYLVNEGMLLSEAAGGALIVKGPALLENRGTIRARNGARLDLRGQLVNTGTVSVEGTLTLDRIPSAANAGNLSVRDGRLHLALGAIDPSVPFRRADIAHLDVSNSVLAPTEKTTLDNTGSTLNVRDGTNRWELLGGNIRGGTLTSSDGTPLAVGGTSSLTDVRAESDLAVAPGGRLILANSTFVAGRTIRLDSGPRPTSPVTGAVLEVSAGEALGPGTRVVFDGPEGTALVQRTGFAMLRVPAGVEVVTGTGGGTLRGSSIVNEGRIAATTGRTITFLPGTAFANGGTLDAAGGDLAFPGGRDQNGQPIPVTLTNTGTVRLGPGGDLNLTGSLLHSDASRLEVVIAGTGAEQFGQLAATGEARLDGGLFVGAAEGTTILPGQSFEVLRFGSRAGDFDTLVNQTPFAGLTFTKVYDADSLTLVAGALSGDATLDGRVDSVDFQRVRANLGRNGADWLDGDVNGDGRVNVRDVQLVRRNLGAELPASGQLGASVVAVPEPAAPLALLIAGGLLLNRRRGV